METSLKIDSIIFLISNIVILFVILNKKINLKNKIFYIFMFFVFNSSYNIMIKPVHEFNKVIVRNFIWHKDLISSFKLNDIIFLLICLFLSINLFKDMKDFIIRNTIKREIFIIIIGVSSYFLTNGYFLDGGKNFIIAMKGIVYFWGGYLISRKFFTVDIKKINYINIFGFILIFGMISLMFFDNQYLWVRYGNSVKIIDQEDAYTISLLVITYYYVKFRIGKRKRDFIVFLLFFIQNLICIYKTNLIYYVFMVIICEIFIGRKKFVKFKLNIIYLSLIIIGILGIKNIINLIDSVAIATRSNQIKDVLNYMSYKGLHSFLFGLGPGSPYISTFNVGDSGEIKTIDAIYGGYRFAVQTPILGVFKIVGIVGIIIYLYYTIKILATLFVKVSYYRDNAEVISLATLLSFNYIFSNSSFSFNGTSPMPLFFGIILGRLIFSFNKDKRKE